MTKYQLDWKAALNSQRVWVLCRNYIVTSFLRLSTSALWNES